MEAYWTQLSVYADLLTGGAGESGGVGVCQT